MVSTCLETTTMKDHVYFIDGVLGFHLVLVHFGNYNDGKAIILSEK